MRRFILALAFCAGLVSAAFAQGGMGPGPGTVHSSGAPYSGPGDVTGFTTGIIAWWGLRGYSSTTTGAIFNVCDNVTGLVCADATWSGGTLTLPTLSGNICDNGIHSCEIAKFYDQSGASSCSGACDTSVAHGSRPLLKVSCLGSLPCMLPGGTSMASANIASSSAQPYSVSSVSNRTSGAIAAGITDGGGNGTELLFGNAANVIALFAGNSVPTAAATDGTVHTIQGLFNNTSSIIFVDATSNTGLSLNTANALSSGAPFHFPSNSNGGLTGQSFEAGWWAGDKSANFSNMHTNQCTYWGTTC